MVSPHKIKYNGVFSDTGLGDLDVVFDVAFESDNGATSSYLNRSAVASESHDGRYKNTYKYKYDELFSPRFTIVKKNFSDFTQADVSKVLKYLTSTDKPALLEVYYEDNEEVSWACIGGWISIETYKIANSRTVGIVAQFEAITPYAMSKIYTYDNVGSTSDDGTVTLKSDTKIIIDINTDDNKPIYPYVTINHGYNNREHTIVDITGTNQFDNILDMIDYAENTVYKNGSRYYWKTSEPTFMYAAAAPEYDGWKTVTRSRAYTSGDENEFESNTFYKYNNTYYWIDPYAFHSAGAAPNIDKTSVILTNTHTPTFGQPTPLPSVIVKNNSSTEVITLDGANKVINSSSVRRIYGDDFNWQWLELYDGHNEITVLGNCVVTIEYREVRKVGEY